MAISLINDRILEEALKNIKAYINTNSDSSKNVSTEINDLMSHVDNLSEEIKNITLESLGGIEEAPNDEFYYLRKNKEWVKIEKIEQDTPVKPDPEDPEDSWHNDIEVKVIPYKHTFPVEGGSVDIKVEVYYKNKLLPIDGYTYELVKVISPGPGGEDYQDNFQWITPTLDSVSCGQNETDESRSELCFWQVEVRNPSGDKVQKLGSAWFYQEKEETNGFVVKASKNHLSAAKDNFTLTVFYNGENVTKECNFDISNFRPEILSRKIENSDYVISIEQLKTAATEGSVGYIKVTYNNESESVDFTREKNELDKMTSSSSIDSAGFTITEDGISATGRIYIQTIYHRHYSNGYIHPTGALEQIHSLSVTDNNNKCSIATSIDDNKKYASIYVTAPEYMLSTTLTITVNFGDNKTLSRNNLWCQFHSNL